MKTLPFKVRAVRSLLAQLDVEIADLQQSSKLYCPSGCGKCCERPSIEVTPLEFLPFALAAFDDERHEDLLKQCSMESADICVIFRPSMTQYGGMCSEYPDRGLMCRLFGYAARRNKEGTAELVTCAIMKTSQNENYNNFQEKLLKEEYMPPFFTDYYMKLRNIDADLCELMPINRAIATALKSVMHYYSYRRRRKPQGR